MRFIDFKCSQTYRYTFFFHLQFLSLYYHVLYAFVFWDSFQLLIYFLSFSWKPLLFHLFSFLNLLSDFLYITEFMYDVNIIFPPIFFEVGAYTQIIYIESIIIIIYFIYALLLCSIQCWNYVSGIVTSDENTYVTKYISNFLSIILSTLLLAENEPLLFCGCH